MQAADLQKYLVKILANPKVDVLRYDKSRILEVKPHGVNKGLAATAILESLWIMSDTKSKAESAAESPRSTHGAPSRSPVSAGGSRFGLQVSPPANGSLAFPVDGPLSPRSLATPFHPFVLAIGDDRSDEDMFIAVQQKSFLDGRVRGRERSAGSEYRICAWSTSYRL
jgi:trehalose-6-phosphatase